MSYFPSSLMPRALKHETTHDSSDPASISARDWNRHHREIYAIERLLIGNKFANVTASGVSGFSCSDFSGKFDCPSIDLGGGDTDAPSSLSDLTSLVRILLDKITNGGLFAQHTGTVLSGGGVPLPNNIVKTTCNANVLATDTTINVGSTIGFPRSGFITKINNNLSYILCQSGDALDGAGRCPGGKLVRDYSGLVDTASFRHATNQELIQYTSKTATSFQGCTRGYGGTTAQDLINNGFFNTSAWIISGQASIFLTSNAWAVGKGTNPRQIIIDHDSMLNVTGHVYSDGTDRKLTDISGLSEIAYCLSVAGQFDDIDLTNIFNLLEL